MRKQWLVVGLAWLIAAACSGDGTGGNRSEVTGGSDGNGGANAASVATNAASTDLALTSSTTGGGGSGPAPPGCGDGMLADDEACDDGGTEDGDGCSANCLQVGAGFSCAIPGMPCQPIALCGDGIVASSEICDDANGNDGDGCSSTCKFEIGFKCEGEPSVCSPTTCGDGVAEGAEACDDGNDLPYDGCSADCQAEPNCSGGACTSTCGDGLLLAEACDDGNTKSGDGCSANCEVEPGFTCMQNVAEADVVNGIQVLRVPVIYRDFTGAHPDFGTTPDQCDGWIPGMVGDTLMNGTPQLVNGAGACTTAATFTDWYTDGDGRTTIPGEIVLFDNGSGGYVNRFGPNGEQFMTGSGQPYADVYVNCEDGARDVVNVPTQCDQRCTLDEHETCYATAAECPEFDSPCKYIPPNTALDGTPLFFPLDDAPSAEQNGEAKIPEQYGWNEWPWEVDALGTGGSHNFYFTTEIHYWFQYDAAATPPVFKFTGDDDVWAFLNGQLIVDLGGIHVPISGDFTLDATTASTYGLADGQVYEIAVFQAERRMEGSSFRLTLQGFDTARTDCVPECGDSIVTLGEQCDDGVNDGGYGECAPGCVLGPYCGDGIVEPDIEDCDDGNRIDTDACNNACRVLMVK